MAIPTKRLLWFLVLSTAAALSPAMTLAQADWSQYPAFFSPCETTLVDAGQAEGRWALLAGVHQDEQDKRGRNYTWTAKSWQARLLLAETGSRTLRLTGRRGPPQLRLRAFWNDVDLGEREVAKGRTSISWTVPAASTRVGLNLLRFEASEARELERQLSFQLERLELEPAESGCGPVEASTAGRSTTLAPGLELELDGQAGSMIELYLSRDGRPQRRIELALDGGRQLERLAVGDLVSTELVAVARGPGTTTLRLAQVAGDDRQGAWRVACGLLWKEPLAATGLLVLLALAVAAGRRWPGGRIAPWGDCALILALALALRAAYLEAYPDMDPSRFGDSWEYLQRSRYLLHGVSFWHDISWHSWQSWIRPPGYYLFLAVFLGPLGGGLTMLAKVQAVLLAATAAAGYLVAYPLFGRGAALAAGLLIAIYPEAITCASWILSDPLALFLTTTALACLSWLAARQSWPLALATGALFGIGCLVRSAPLFFVPLAALLLYLGQRRPRRKAPALALVAATALVVLPWCIRNSILYAKPMGIDDLVIPNFLMAHPDPEILPAELQETGVWGEDSTEMREIYFGYLWRANRGAPLTRDSGRILGRGLLRMAASPGTTLKRFGLHLGIYFRPFPRFYAAQYLPERRGCPLSTWTDAFNGVYLLVLVLAIPGAVLAIGRRQAWPLIAWVLFFVVVTNLFFYPSYMPGRYRLPIYPVMAALAGLTLSRVGEVVASRLSRRRKPAAEA
jgi:4-amino-4-deoxy-L-arabinose transferase-like glycosyltransferase